MRIPTSRSVTTQSPSGVQRWQESLGAGGWLPSTAQQSGSKSSRGGIREKERRWNENNVQPSLNTLLRRFYEILPTLRHSSLQIKQDGDRLTEGKSCDPRARGWSLNLKGELPSGCAPSSHRERPALFPPGVAAFPHLETEGLSASCVVPQGYHAGHQWEGSPASHNCRKPRKAWPWGKVSTGSLGDETGTNGAQGNQCVNFRQGQLNMAPASHRTLM